jgi:hypothetical protein
MKRGQATDTHAVDFGRAVTQREGCANGKSPPVCATFQAASR